MMHTHRQRTKWCKQQGCLGRAELGKQQKVAQAENDQSKTEAQKWSAKLDAARFTDAAKSRCRGDHAREMKRCEQDRDNAQRHSSDRFRG